MTYSKKVRVESTPRHITVREAGQFQTTDHPLSVQTNIKGRHALLQRKFGKEQVLITLAELMPDGWLTIYPGFCYDGPSGAVNTHNTMRASAFHDVLCEMIGLDKIPRTLIPVIAKLYTDLCLDDGMTGFRAWFHFRATHLASPEPGEYLKVTVYP